MLDCVSWDAEVNSVPTAFALTFDDRNKNTIVTSISQSGSPGSIISVESTEHGDLEMNIVLGDRECELFMLLARRLHAELFRNKQGLMKLMLLLSLQDKTDSSIIPQMVHQVCLHNK